MAAGGGDGDAGTADGLRAVEVAVDAAGAAATGRTPTSCPTALADLEPGEAVLVEFGRRQALGVVLGRGRRRRPTVAAKPIVDRVRADGPLLPPLTLALARWIADHYLAPPALVLRAMLPPGLLERLELVAELAPGGRRSGPTPGVADDPADARPARRSSSAARARSATWPAPTAGPACCAGSGRWPRRAGSASTGRCSAPASGPRYERWIRPDGGGPRRRRRRSRTASRRRAGRSDRARSRRSHELAGAPAGEAARGGPRRPARARGRRRPRPPRARRGRGPRATAAAAGRATRRAARRPARRRATCCPPRRRRSARSVAAIARPRPDARSCSTA